MFMPQRACPACGKAVELDELMEITIQRKAGPPAKQKICSECYWVTYNVVKLISKYHPQIVVFPDAEK
jgi:NMD protein affecting ribosome stability and mRNA decay